MFVSNIRAVFQKCPCHDTKEYCDTGPDDTVIHIYSCTVPIHWLGLMLYTINSEQGWMSCSSFTPLPPPKPRDREGEEGAWEVVGDVKRSPFCGYVHWTSLLLTQPLQHPCPASRQPWLHRGFEHLFSPKLLLWQWNGGCNTTPHLQTSESVLSVVYSALTQEILQTSSVADNSSPLDHWESQWRNGHIREWLVSTPPREWDLAYNQRASRWWWCFACVWNKDTNSWT